ncbi:MAG: D-glycero-beta-D-manno-heptose-7-phosphate kinase [Bacteroidetes bacterium]|nr:D-glycero-beta-D-manno-heptose-7-phosphate kinase [Bacteroidota bacterium]
MLDMYLWGRVERISPEAPVPVVDVEREEYRLGGAANVAFNLLSLGAQPVLCGVIGRELVEGEQFLALMARHGLPADGILALEDRRTTTKMRVLGSNQQMLRVDKEDKGALSAHAQALLKEILTGLVQHQPLDAVIFEDYDKGLLNADLIAHITTLARQRGIPVLVDPKFANFLYYRESTVFKPNLKELNEAMALQLQRGDLAGIAAAALSLRTRMPHRHTMITLSEHGVLLVDQDGQAHHIPAHLRQIRDVSGAGDTVISVMAAALSCGLSPVTAAALANLAGGLVCEQPGVAPIDPQRLAREAGRLGLQV